MLWQNANAPNTNVIEMNPRHIYYFGWFIWTIQKLINGLAVSRVYYNI